MSSQVETTHVKAPRSPFSRARFDNFYTHRERFRLRSQWWPPHEFLPLVPHLDKTTPILDDISYLVSRGWARSRQPTIGRLRSTDLATAITIQNLRKDDRIGTTKLSAPERMSYNAHGFQTLSLATTEQSNNLQ